MIETSGPRRAASGSAAATLALAPRCFGRSSYWREIRLSNARARSGATAVVSPTTAAALAPEEDHDASASRRVGSAPSPPPRGGARAVRAVGGTPEKARADATLVRATVVVGSSFMLMMDADLVLGADSRQQTYSSQQQQTVAPVPHLGGKNMLYDSTKAYMIRYPL